MYVLYFNMERIGTNKVKLSNDVRGFVYQ